jgi:hypothetical protein
MFLDIRDEITSTGPVVSTYYMTVKTKDFLEMPQTMLLN